MTRLLMLVATVGLAGVALAADSKIGSPAQAIKARAEAAAEKQAERQAEKQAERAAAEKGRVPIDLKLPKPAFKGTPKHVPPGTILEKPTGKPRPPFKAPKGARNIAKGKPIHSSDEEPIIGELRLITDGDKEAVEGSYVELGPGLQHVTIDLKGEYKLYAIAVWRYHMSARVYHDVVIQIADDEDFIENVRTIFNNDHDNSAGLGVGTDKGFWETYEGQLVDAMGAVARYVRLYSRGSTSDEMNHYTEVEVYGLPAK